MLPLYLRPLRWLAFVGLATACAPTYQLGLKPAHATGLFAEGREQVRAVADALQQKAALLQDHALRKVILAPGQQVRGYLYFPRCDAADGLALKAPVGSRVVPLEFARVRRRQ